MTVDCARCRGHWQERAAWMRSQSVPPAIQSYQSLSRWISTILHYRFRKERGNDAIFKRAEKPQAWTCTGEVTVLESQYARSYNKGWWIRQTSKYNLWQLKAKRFTRTWTNWSATCVNSSAFCQKSEVNEQHVSIEDIPEISPSFEPFAVFLLNFLRHRYSQVSRDSVPNCDVWRIERGPTNSFSLM